MDGESNRGPGSCPPENRTAITLTDSSGTGGEWSFRPPERLGPYRLVREIGRGGMGLVFEAHDETLDRRAALKLLGPWLVGKPDSEARIVVEAKALARLGHGGIVQVYGAAREGEIFYFAMELVEGDPLSVLLEEGPLSPERTMHLGVQMASALAAAHEKEIVHRDLKPSNILVRTGGETKITDFGLARSPDDARLTASGELFGTPAYMAPEQVLGDAPAPPMDVYALGVVLYEMLSGRPPFEGGAPVAVAMKHVQETPTDVRVLSSQTPRGLGDLVMQCLAKDASGRHSAAEMASRLEVLLSEYRALEASLESLYSMSPRTSEDPESSEYHSAWGVVVFADVAGFTPIADAVKPALLGRLLSEVHVAMRRAVETAGGYLEKFMADCCLAVFMADEPAVAVSRALESSEDLHESVRNVGAKFSQELRLGVGMCAGEFFIGPVHDGRSHQIVVMGNTANTASRVQSQCPAGKTLAAGEIPSFLPDGWEAAPFKEVDLKGGGRLALLEVHRKV